MTAPISAVYQGGVLRPDSPLPLAEGAHVRLVILPAAESAPGGPPTAGRAAGLLAAIAARSVQPGPPEATSRDHDQVLYGQPHSP